VSIYGQECIIIGQHDDIGMSFKRFGHPRHAALFGNESLAAQKYDDLPNGFCKPLDQALADIKRYNPDLRPFRSVFEAARSNANRLARNLAKCMTRSFPQIYVEVS
jgi:hypothetical protein